MDEYETLQTLSKLPAPQAIVHRPVPPVWSLVGNGSSGAVLRPDQLFAPHQLHVSSQVEEYVRDVINSAPLLTGEVDLTPVMDHLFVHQGLAVPVVELHHVQNAVSALSLELQRQLAAVPHVYARMLRTLNPPGTPVIAPDLVALAAERERAMAGLRHGWGTSRAPISATAHRLLLSVGVDPCLLPPVKTPPADVRTPLMLAWHDACKRFGWLCVHPDKDIAAERRCAHQTTQAELAAINAPVRPPSPETPHSDVDGNDGSDDGDDAL